MHWEESNRLSGLTEQADLSHTLTVNEKKLKGFFKWKCNDLVIENLLAVLPWPVLFQTVEVVCSAVSSTWEAAIAGSGQRQGC